MLHRRLVLEGEAKPIDILEITAEGRKAYIIPGGGSNALGGLGYVACAQELQQQMYS